MKISDNVSDLETEQKASHRKNKGNWQNSHRDQERNWSCESTCW